MSRYLNIPDIIASKIEEAEPSYFSTTYRGLYHVGKPELTDFLPTFVDEKQEAIRIKRTACGPMASDLVNLHKKKLGKKEYGVSLFTSLDSAKKVLWRYDSYKEDYPAIASGPTLDSRGYSILDNERHISYYLFDYITNNPFSDYATIKEEDLGE